jgi:hypothetical protein
MNLTTNPAAVPEQNRIVRPEFIRLPKPGTSDPWTSLSRSTLNLLVLPCRENDYRPPVRSCTLRKRGTTKGVRLIDFESLLDHINTTVEPAYLRGEPKPQFSDAVRPETVVREVSSGERFRIIISVQIERAAV